MSHFPKSTFDRLANMATSPASEAQAGGICRENYALVPVRKRPSCCDRGRDLSGGVSEECCGNGNCSQDAEEARARASWLTAPLPASSPVAAEGQVGWVMVPREPTFEMNKAGQEAVWDFNPGDTIEHNECVARAAYFAMLDAVAPQAAPTPEAEAVATILRGPNTPWGHGTVLQRWENGSKALPPGEHKLYTHPSPQAPTPGPRGENAGGVAPAGYKLVSGSAYGQRYVSLVDPAGKIIINAYEEGNPPMFAFLAACATAWGLRIAEKGDDRG